MTQCSKADKTCIPYNIVTLVNPQSATQPKTSKHIRRFIVYEIGPHCTYCGERIESLSYIIDWKVSQDNTLQNQMFAHNIQKQTATFMATQKILPTLDSVLFCGRMNGLRPHRVDMRC